VAADPVKCETWDEFGVTIVEYGSFRIDQTHHLERVVEVERRAQRLVAHAPARRKSYFTILQMETRARKTVEISRVIVMQVRENDIAHLGSVQAEQAQRFGRAAQPFALSASRCLLAETRVHHERAIAAAHDPHEVVEIGGEFVRISEDKILSRMAIAKMRVANREDLEGFERHGAPRGQSVNCDARYHRA